MECFIGACLLAGRLIRLARWLLAVQLLGVLAPLVLLPGRLFGGPSHAPTLEGQYVLEDVILVAAGMVIVAGTLRGGHIVHNEPRGRGSEPLLTTPGEAAEHHELEKVLSRIGWPDR